MEKITNKIFPFYELIDGGKTWEVKTVLRKQNSIGEFYFCNISEKATKIGLFGSVITDKMVIDKLLLSAYTLLLFGIIDNRNSLFFLDDNQELEQERLGLINNQ